jgi:hypothetical protein
MGEEALKACPWCKASPTPYETRDGETFFRHPRNQCILNDFRIAPEDVAAWNIRPSTLSEDDVERVARAIWALPQDPPNETYSLKMVMTWDTARRIAAALAAMSGG